MNGNLESQRVLLSILMVSYNTSEMTRACIRSIYDQAENDCFEIIAVDNASHDGSADAIAKEFAQVELIRSSENLGFARANNLAKTRASGDYLLLLNPDTVILDHAIDKLLAFAQSHPHARIWGGRTLYGDGTLNPTSCWRFMSLWSLFSLAIGLTALWRDHDHTNPEGYGGWKRDSDREVDIITGCFLLINRDLWEELGGFDESFFMYAEEADLCYRARLAGARPVFTPNATIIHYGGASERIFSLKMIRLLSAKAHFITKHWQQPKRSLGIGLLQFWVFWRKFIWTLVAKINRKKKYDAVSREWQAVWSARRQWANGYFGSGHSETMRGD